MSSLIEAGSVRFLSAVFSLTLLTHQWIWFLNQPSMLAMLATILMSAEIVTFIQVLGPEIAPFCQFLAPETGFYLLWGPLFK